MVRRLQLCYKGQHRHLLHNRHERREFRFSLKLLRLGKAVQREPLSKHLMNLLQKEKKPVFPSALPDTYNKVTFSNIGFSRSLALSIKTLSSVKWPLFFLVIF